MVYYKGILLPFFMTMSDLQDLSIEAQIALGKPSSVEQLNKHQVQEYLQFLEHLLSENIIQSYTPSSFIRKELYTTLPSYIQGKVDQASVVLAGYVRTLEKLLGSEHLHSRQVEQYVEHIWHYKEKYERQIGDIFLL